MVLKESLKNELIMLIENSKWKEIRAWFGYWNKESEMIDKVLLWGSMFMKDYFRDESPMFHRDLIKAFFSSKNEYIACPRGFAKTTICQLCVGFSSANQIDKFIVIIEKSFTEASEMLSAVRDVFVNNPITLQVYGNLIKFTKDGTEDEKSKDSMGDILINGVRIRAKGFDTPIRGLKSKEWRPTRIILDDVESDKHVYNVDQRLKHLDNYTKGIIPAIDIEYGSIKMFGTILHQDSLLKNLIDSHNGKIYRAWDENEELLWPERWSKERLEKKRQEMEIEGKGSGKFAQEYLNLITDEEDRTFRWEWLTNFFVPADLRMKHLNRYAAIDVADSKLEGADYTGVVIVDWDAENNWFIQRVKRYRVNAKELVDLIFEIWQIDTPLKIGVEKRAFGDQIKPFLEQKSQETGIRPIVVELEHGGQRKEDRIQGALLGRFEQKKIYFKQNAEDDTRILMGELYDFPRGKNDDLIDSLAYIIQVGKRPFKPNEGQIMPQLHKEFYEYKKAQMKSQKTERVFDRI